MPEGHTLHRLAAALGEAFRGDRVAASSPQGRFAGSAALIDGAVVHGAQACGKHLFVEFGADRVLHVHLGLYGAFVRHALPLTGPPEPVGQVRLRLVGARWYADLRGATACELLDGPEQRAIEQRLGPDPLRADADPERMWAMISKSRRPIAALLMDQTVVAGIGNVYRAELLFRSGIDPQVQGTQLSRRTVTALWEDICVLMAHGVRTGRIDTLRPEDDPVGSLSSNSPRAVRCARGVYVYRRQGDPCRVCSTRVRTQVLAGRNLFWCPRCQRRRTARPVVSGVPTAAV
ncbi:MAG: Fpg/Nei family DNA glycosylase [Actinomycetota bacterium]|nr:Fpg/Nei family DNA glycosylase [Actinomycetota bacterium]